MRLKWTRKAESDLNALYEYYYLKSPQTASQIHNIILDEVERLIKSPNIGIRIEELSTERLQVRSIVILGGSYKILYAANKEKVAIYRIWSCRQNPENFKI